MLMVLNLTARPMVLLDRQPCPKRPIPEFMSISRAIGPFVIITRLKAPDEPRVWKKNSPS